MKIRPWPFGENIVYLHWIGNVKMKNNQWYIRAAFVNNNELNVIELPIGILPTLKIGVPYKDGLPLYTQKEGTYTNFVVKDISQGTTNKAIDICRKFNVFLYKNPELMNQNIWSLTVNHMTFHIPHTEFIRALFTPNKTLANALLRPNGLDLLVNQSNIQNNGNTLYVDFADEIPGSIMNDDFARYFSCIYFNDGIKKSFESVQSNVYTYGFNNGTQYGIPLAVNLPSTGQITIAARGIQRKNEILVLEILGIDNIILPFYELQYRHKSIKKYIYTDKPKKKRISKQKKEVDYILNEKDGEQSREDSNQPVIELDPIQMAFRHSTVVTRIPKQEQKVNQGDEYISNIGRGGGVKKRSVGVDDSVYGGTITPIEFSSLEIADSYNNYGLDPFLEMINALSDSNRNINISLNFFFMPIGRKFTWLPNGRRRIFIIVKIINGKKISYVIEVAVPEIYRSISTLIIMSTGDSLKDEGRISYLMNNLLLKGGNWSTDFLNNIPHMKVKHMKESRDQWMRRLIKHI